MAKMKEQEIAQALGEPNRLRIYTQIAQNEELFCGEMHAKSEISAATLSHHLKVLSDPWPHHIAQGRLECLLPGDSEKLGQYLSDLAHIGHKSRA
jgi:ArsR family transcriptional regulator